VRAPDIVIKYSLQSGGAEFTDYPTVAGKYKAKIAINNPASSNYELDAATASKEVLFEIRGAVTITADDLIWQANDNVPSSFALPWLPGGYTLIKLNPCVSLCAGITDVTCAVNSVQAALRHTEDSA